MSNLNILKVNVTANLIKIISFWVGTVIISTKCTLIAVTINTKFKSYDELVIKVDSLESWKRIVEAYYTKPKPDTVYINKSKI